MLFNDLGVKVIYPEISFKCNPELKCGICCKIAPADLNEEEYLRILKAGYEDFAYEIGYGIYQMREIDRKGCIFLEDYKCKIHEIRPSSCIAFPFTPAFFDFHDDVLVCIFDPKALRFCKGIGDEKGDIERDIIYESASACLKLFLDRVKILSKFKSLNDAFLLTALSTPKKIGLINKSPWKSQCYCCGHPLVISHEYKIYKEITRDFKDFGGYLVCEKCFGGDLEKKRKKLLFNSNRRIIKRFFEFP